MDAILAIAGFWFCIFALIVRKPIMKMIEQKQIGPGDTSKLEERCLRLEKCVSDVNTELIRVAKELDEIRSSSDSPINCFYSNKQILSPLPQKPRRKKTVLPSPPVPVKNHCF